MLTTYQNSTHKITEEEIALSLQTLLINNQPHNMIAHQPEGRYTMDGRRLALIVCDKSREGSQHDFQRVLEFGAQHGFSCYETTKFTEVGLMEQLKDFKTSLDEDVCCLTLFIMAHGSLGHINVSDGQIELQRIFEMFDNRRCPALRGKPKLFVIQACRGVEVERCSKQPCFDASELSGVKQEQLWPVESDALFVYAACPGNMAIRYPDTGSPLFEEMNVVFSQSDSMSMFDRFTMVNGRLVKRIEREGFKTDRLWQIPKNLVMPGMGRRRETTPPVAKPLHIVDRLTEKWYL